MRRPLAAALLLVVGLLLLADFVIVNPTLADVAAALLELVVLLAAFAAVAGALSLGVRHVGRLLRPGSDRIGSAILLLGMAAMLAAGLAPGSAGASDMAVRWLVVALLGPLVAALFALTLVYLLAGARRSIDLRPRESAVMLGAAVVVLILLLPLGGAPGAALGGVASWVLAVPVDAVFRGILIALATATAVTAARLLLGIGAADE